ncbi:hypothetical protein PAMA_012213 [Pampus argenteus]
MQRGQGDTLAAHTFHRQMMVVAFFSLLFVIDAVCSERICSYQDVVNHLNLTKNKELYTMTRPVKDYRQTTSVFLEVLLSGILEVVEKEQTLISSVWTAMRWHNDYISWDQNQFCGIDNVSLPTDTLWKPDLIIEEIKDVDKSIPTRYLTVNDKGDVELQNNWILISTCKMHIYRFPFDTQRCNLSFQSFIYSVKEIQLEPIDNSSEATVWSNKMMHLQNEWIFLNMTVTKYNGIEGQDVIIYTITMERRAILYVVNFLLPILFFLFLDLASFLISDNGGEKLSFKVTVLLAVTVLQLLLNEILPASSNRIPLIASFCIGIFGLMLLSLLETIFVMRLIEKDHVSQSDEADEDRCLSQDCGLKQAKVNFCNAHRGESASELLHVTKQGNSSKQIEESHTFETLLDELKEINKTLTLMHNSGKEEKCYRWTRLAKRVDRVFFILYVTLIGLFLSLLCSKWNIS